MLLTTFEILLTIVAPLLALYLCGAWPLRTVVACLVVVPAAWYLAYAPIHELSHAAAALLVGGRVTEIKLIPSFWEGTFAVAWVHTAGLDEPWEQLAMGGAPYLLDVVSIAVGLAVLRRRVSRSALAAGLLVMLLILRPTFDLLCETVGFVGGFRGDLWHAEAVVGSGALWVFLAAGLALSLVSIVVVVRRYGSLHEARFQPARPEGLAAATR